MTDATTLLEPDQPVSNIDLTPDVLEEKQAVPSEGEADDVGPDGLELAGTDFPIRSAPTPAAESASVAVAPSTDGLRSAVEASYDIDISAIPEPI